MMTDRNDVGSPDKVMPVAVIEIGESLGALRGNVDTRLRLADGAPRSEHDLEDSFGSWREMDKVD